MRPHKIKLFYQILRKQSTELAREINTRIVARDISSRGGQTAAAAACTALSPRFTDWFNVGITVNGLSPGLWDLFRQRQGSGGAKGDAPRAEITSDRVARTGLSK